MTHPDFVATLEEADSIRTVQPVYSLTQGLTQKVIKRAVDGALDRAPGLAEWVDEKPAGAAAMAGLALCPEAGASAGKRAGSAAGVRGARPPRL